MGNESKVQQRESESMMGMPVKKSVEWFMGGRGLEGGKCVYKPLVNIYHNNLIWLLMDPGSCDESIIDRLMNQPGEQENRRSSQGSEQSRQGAEDKGPRRPGRPPLRIKNRPKVGSRNSEGENENDEDFEADRPKGKERSLFVRQEKESNLEGFIKIIDYLKKIECDEASLHNKMNPYNLLTPTCFWYMVSAEYFSFDFFSGKNPQELALQFLRRAQKTQIVLPLRFIKPQKTEVELEFETPQLRVLSTPITERLTTLSSLLSSPLQSYPEQIEKAGHLSSIAEDNQFRSSTRAMVFNWIKKKVVSSEKWGSALKPRLDGAVKIPSKEFTSTLHECESEVKHEQLEVAPQIYYRQRRAPKNENQIKKPKPIKRAVLREKKLSKKSMEDEIYDESESEEVKNEDKKPAENNQMEEEMPVDRCDVMEAKNECTPGLIPASEVQNEMQAEVEPKHEVEDSEDEREGGRGKACQTVSFTKEYGEDDVLLDAILHMPLDNIISILKLSIESPKLPYLTRPFMPALKNDPLELVYQMHPDEEVFLNYMKERQEKMYLDKTSHSETLIEEKEREGQVEDAKCQVCTDGDYTEDNLIVFCSMCNISLHQRCVGLAKVPVDNWVCEVCASFGPAGINVPCPLCHVKGGALKRTSIHINTPLFKDTNPEYHEYAKKCPNYKHKEEYLVREGMRAEEEPYYDYFSKTSYPSEEPVCHFVWVHYVCAIWIPECYFEEKNGLINIKGIENIDKKRFKEKCLVCKEVRAGACVKCDNENCTKYYHPECARKKRIYMEQLNLDKLKYLIFCEAHEPLKVKRKIEVKKKKQRDEIVKFCRGIEKYVETYKIANLPFKLLKLGTGSGCESARLDTKKEKVLLGDHKIMIKLEKNTDEDFIKSVIEWLIKQNQIIVNLTCLGGDKYKIDEVIKPSKRDMRKSLTRLDEFWRVFKNSESPEANLKRFNAIMRESNYLKEKIENFINFGSNTEETPGKEDKRGSRRGFGGRKKREKVETVVEEQGALFCVCRRPYNGENDMFECEVCNEWYHHECIGFIGSEEDAQKLVFHCMKCLKYESPEAKKELLDKCSQLFSEDSLYLNYRPPTPSLQSEEESGRNNFGPIDENKKQATEVKQTVAQPQKQQKVEKTKGRVEQMKMMTVSKINLDMPFIVYDPAQVQSKPALEKPSPEEMEPESPKFGNDQAMEVEQPREPNGQQIVNSPLESNRADSISLRQSDLQQAINRTYSSQSSQLPTPEFKSAVYSFAGVGEECMERLAEERESERADGEMEEENESNKPNTEFHFDRCQVERLKSEIEEQEKLGGQKSGNTNTIP